jgi:hypothetical protein
MSAEAWQYPLSQLNNRLDNHEKLDETKFASLSRDMTDVKEDVAGIKGRIIGACAVLSLIIPILTTIITEIVHYVRGVHVP